MAKYSTKFKYEIVKRYLDGEGSYESLSKTFNIPDKHQIRVRVNAYQTLGYDGLKRSRNKKQYSTDFKLKVVKLYLTGEMSYQSIANEMKINNPSIIVRWVKEFREEGIEGLKPKKRGRPSNMPNKDKNKDLKNKSKKTKKEFSELEKLREDNYYLKMEVEILKKKIQFSQMTESEIDEYLRSLDH